MKYNIINVIPEISNQDIKKIVNIKLINYILFMEQNNEQDI